MSTYKVIQDIEAEDKLVGPLTLRQFIYAGVSLTCLYLTFVVITKGAPYIAILFIPVAGVCGFFAFPWGRDQPTEIWALAKIRFLFKPRVRIWDQTGVKELVTITVPKRVEKTYTNGLSQREVHSRLQALAETIDSRGWAVKNVNVNIYGQPPVLAGMSGSSQRLIDTSTMPQAVPSYDVVSASEDMLDEVNSPVAQQLDSMIASSSKQHRDEIMERLKRTGMPHQANTDVNADGAAMAQKHHNRDTPDYWFLNQTNDAPLQQGMATFQGSQVVAPAQSDDATASGYQQPVATSDDAQLLASLPPVQLPDRDITSAYHHLRTIQPPGYQSRQTPAVNRPPVPAAQPVTQAPDPAILELARNNDLNVATIAREARREQQLSEDEVVISLH